MRLADNQTCRCSDRPPPPSASFSRSRPISGQHLPATLIRTSLWMLLCPSHLQQAFDSTCHASPTSGLSPLLHWTHLLDPRSSQISSSHVLKHGMRTHCHRFPTGSGPKLTEPSPTVPAPALGLRPSHQRLRPARALVLSLLPPPPNPWSLNPGDPPAALTCL